jgi:hypothetical protein
MGQRRCRLWLGAAALAAACSPAFDWREVRPEASAALALFPCRPASHARRLHLGGVDTEMSMYACTASGATFALAYADVGDSTQVDPALASLRQAAQRNVAGKVEPDGDLVVIGMTPNRLAQRVRIVGHLPSGEAAQMAVAFFTRGTRVFQASVVSPRPLDAEAVNTFFSGFRLVS